MEVPCARYTRQSGRGSDDNERRASNLHGLVYVGVLELVHGQQQPLPAVYLPKHKDHLRGRGS
jgi:hypothetical protein